MDGLTDKTALVSGGSRGIGEAVVRDLAARGVRVAFSYKSSEDKAAELVKGLDQREDQPEQEQIAGRQDPVEQTLRQRVEVEDGEQGGRHHGSEPERHAGGTDQGPNPVDGRGEEALGVDQAYLNGQRAQESAHATSTAMLLVALEELRGVGLHVALEQVGVVELGQQSDQVVLAG